MAADLTELQEGIEDGELGLFESLRGDRFANFFIHGGADRFVEVALGRTEFDGMNEDGFGREFLGDLIFVTAKNEGGEAGAEEIAAFVVFFFLDGSLVELAESVERAEEAGNEKAEERPEFAKIVFDGSAGETEALAGLELAGGLGDFGGRVFDVLSFIEDGDGEVVLFEFVDVAL